MKDSEETLPSPPTQHYRRSKHARRRLAVLPSLLFLLALTIAILILNTSSLSSFPSPLLSPSSSPLPRVLKHRKHLVKRCKALRTPAGPPPDFRPESRLPFEFDASTGKKGRGSDRFVLGTPPVLLKNARIWTGERNGTYTIYGDVLLDKGLIVAVGRVPNSLLEDVIPVKDRRKMVVMDLEGKWITPGLVDLHSHIGVASAPELRGNEDGNSFKAPIAPWLRSIDGLNTHDESYRLAIAGGVTTAQILPGSAANIGGQAFVIKLRPTSEGSASSKMIEPPETLHYPNTSVSGYIHWRHMKHACGENPNKVHSQTRMDTAWNFRDAYNKARKVKEAQDQFCEHVEAGRWDAIERDAMDHKKKDEDLALFPEDLQWESLVDVLRGKVKLSIHCHEAVDLDFLVRLSNEAQFPITSIHHAAEAYLVPDLLKKTWGGTPAIAIHASNFGQKREAYRGSEFASRILSDHDIPVVLKSDHPVLNSRYLLFEAQQAHYHGLSASIALSSVTSVPARVAGLGHRIGLIARDIAVWDSHPLALGAAPVQVFIDGIAQLDHPQVVRKPSILQQTPANPDWDCEAAQAVKWEGLPPLEGHKRAFGKRETIRFNGVNSMWIRDDDGNIVNVFGEDQEDNVEGAEGNVVVVREGRIDCIGRQQGSCQVDDLNEADEELVFDLQGGSLAPALTTFGSPLGLVELRYEPSTTDGEVKDPLTNGNLPDIVGNGTLMRAVDGLQFSGRNNLLAYREGISTAISVPLGSGFLLGVSAAFAVGSSHSLERGAIVLEETAVHVVLSPSLSVSVSTQIATLRRLVFEGVGGKTWARIRRGDMPIVAHVDSADIMATLIKMKTDYEETIGNKLRLTFAGATEAHLIADEIAKAGVSVIVTEPRPYPATWDKSRFLPGPPLSADSLVTTLLQSGVNVAIGVVDESVVRNTRFELAWMALNSNGKISKAQALSLATTNLERALGLDKVHTLRDIVAYRGGSMFDMQSKVVGVISPGRKVLETFGCRR
ncbi:hypothetical protein AX17_005410 [Amanita inopinata Kibby_2008]|nr:hypothetical protein AX17_005410 [Amanita inopinata Kibby_2008]